MHPRVKKAPLFSALAACLTFSFNAAATEASYWKHPDYDAVVKIEPCAPHGLCGNIHSLNPEDDGVRQIIGRILKKPVKALSTDEVLSFCGYKGDINLKKVAENVWDGKIFWPFRDKYYGVKIREMQDHATIRGYLVWLPILGVTEKLTRVENPAPACTTPAPVTPRPIS